MSKLYIHEYIDIIGHNRARYMHHMTANWCPIAREERNQLCLGVWALLGSTGGWPQVVNMWELDGWDGLAANFAHETGGPGDQDPSLAEWWSVAADLRRGGFDRIMVATDWTRDVEQLLAEEVWGEVYAHELIRVPPGTAGDFLALVRDVGVAAVQSQGLDLVGAYEVAMADASEVLLLWAIPTWDTWVAYEQAWEPGGELAPWASVMTDAGARWRRELLVDSPLNPMWIGRQPEVSDRVPLDEL